MTSLLSTFSLLFLAVPVYSDVHAGGASSFLVEERGIPESSGASEALRFDRFVLFGQVSSHAKFSRTGCKFQLSVEIGDKVWVQTLQSRIYFFQLPTANLSESFGKISIKTVEENKQTLWHQAFVIQHDIGAQRVDIDFEVALDAPHCYRHVKEGGKTVVMMKEIQGLGREMASIYHPVEVLQAYVGQFNSSCQRIPGMFEERGQGEKGAVGSVVIKQKDGREFEVLYPWQLILYANRLQRWHIASLIACFCTLQLVNGLLRKSILVLKASNLSEFNTTMRGFSSSNDERVASWQLCLSKRASAKSVEGYREGNSFVGQGCLQEAWEDAEHYLNEVVNNDRQGAYFSYNCITPHHVRQETVSGSGSWNRNHVGRLIRQLWPVND